MPKTFRKLNGDVMTYDTKKYNATWYAKNKKNVLRKIMRCECCNIELAQSNYSNHKKTKKIEKFLKHLVQFNRPKSHLYGTPQMMPHSWLRYANSRVNDFYKNLQHYNKNYIIYNEKHSMLYNVLLMSY